MVHRITKRLRCQGCGRFFRGRPYQLRLPYAFCSLVCSGKYAGDKRLGTHYPGKAVTRKCNNCGKKIIRARSCATLKHIFCNRACMSEWQRGSIPWNKGKPWGGAVKKKISIAEKKSGNSARHNNPASKTKGPWKNVTCATCGCAFHLRPSSIQRVERNYCSPGCRNIGHSQVMRGPNNPSWLGGNKDGYSTEFLCDIRLTVRKRDVTCQMCGCEEGDVHLCVHHIDYNKENNNLWNLVTLCPSCHGTTNAHRRAWQAYFRILLAEYRGQLMLEAKEA